MRLTTFNREKYYKAIQVLEARRAPAYVIEAYKDGETAVVNEYYRLKLARFRKNQPKQVLESTEVITMVNVDYLNEAAKVKDLEFIKAFFKMANLDLVSGNRLPPNAANLIKQGIAKDMDLNKLFKKLT